MQPSKFLTLAFLLFALALHNAAHANNASPSILLLLKDGEAVDVNIFLKKDAGTAGAVGAFTGGIGGLFVGAAVESRNKNLASELAAKLPDGLDRFTPVSEAIAKLFEQKLPEFTLSVSTDPSLLSDSKPDFSNKELARFSHVLVLSPALSYQTSNYWKDLVIPGLFAKATLFDTATKKKLFQRALFAPAGTQGFWKDAVTQEQPLIDSLPVASGRMATGLYFNLLRADALHELAQETSAAKRFPAIKPILKSELQGFKFKSSVPSGWKKLPTADKYYSLATQKGKGNTLTLLTHIDLLLPELEQDCSDIPCYLELQNQLNPSVSATPLDSQAFPLASLQSGWEAYTLKDSSTLSIAVFKIEGHYLIKHVLSADSETPEADLKAGLPSFLQYVNDSRFTRN